MSKKENANVYSIGAVQIQKEDIDTLRYFFFCTRYKTAVDNTVIYDFYKNKDGEIPILDIPTSYFENQEFDVENGFSLLDKYIEKHNIPMKFDLLNDCFFSSNISYKSKRMA